jgi:hypothetical protein
MKRSFDLETVAGVAKAAAATAKRYRELTGRPLGITGEMGEILAAELLGLKLAPARQPGYDAISRDGRRVQIKSRCIPPDAKPVQRIGQIRFDHDWDTVALILMNEDFEPLEIWEAQREHVRLELERPGSKARNLRGALGVNKFKQIAELLWTAPGETKPS